MKTIKTSIKKLGIFTIGQQNDSDVLDVVFDITEWKELYPYLTSYGVLVTSPDGIVYPANTEVIENELVWHVSGADTAVVGEGEYQIVAVSESGNKKHTTPQKFSIIANMPGIEDAGDAPEHIEPWYEGVVQKASEAQESARKAEEAAQRAENAGVSQEAIGNAVADYLEKNPVQEKDPTVSEWAKAKEKPKYTAEEVGALPKDTPIPEAYTLPTASADTLGGVKVGNGLQMDGDALGVKEDVYELIETVIIGYELLTEKPDDWEENYDAYYGYKHAENEITPQLSPITTPNAWAKNYIYRRTGEAAALKRYYPDDERYRFKAVRLLFNTTERSGATGASGFSYFRCNNSAAGMMWHNLNSNEADIYAMDEIQAINGYWHVDWTTWRTGGDSSKTEYHNGRLFMYPVAKLPYINHIDILQVLPVGTFVKIWGVRA